MNNLPVEKIVNAVAPTFEEMAAVHGAVTWKQEASFALQALSNNKYLAKVALANPQSLQQAIINVAAVGLSLNPVHARAYLVPRDNQVCLDISYRGYIYLPLQIGSLEWVQAEVVHKNDIFKVLGQGDKPLHQFEPFGDRGEVVGVYVVAKTKEGDFLSTTMSVDEVNAIRDRSASFKSGKNGPWATDYGEMAKKTVIRRAYKTWPMVEKNERLAKAIDMGNEAEGINFKEQPKTDHSEAHKGEIRKNLERIGRSEEKFLGYLERIIDRELASLDEMTEPELERALTIVKELPTPKKDDADEVA